MAPYEKMRVFGEECSCDSCVFLKTEVGQAMMTWASNFVAECKEAVKLGVEATYSMSLNLNGPTGEELADMPTSLRGSGRVYATMRFNINNIATHAPALISGPDFDVLIEEYADDPVLLPTLKWMKKRYGP